MIGFNKKAINLQGSRTKRWIKSHIILSVIAVFLGVLCLRGLVGAIQVGNPFSVKQIMVSAVTNSMFADIEVNFNILLVGVGGLGHDGENLTDTMIIASINRKTKLVPMLSIPRDLYVENEMVGWGTRINGIYEYIYDDTEDSALAMNELIKELEKISGVPIHYYAKIDFTGFEEVVDALGGITVNVEQEIYDASFPAPVGSAYTYEPFYLEAGTQELDGETALKYARSRHTTSDFDRARRQQEIIDALRQKAMSVGFLLNPNKIKNTLDAVSDNFETNLTMSEMLHLASMASDFSSESVLSEVFNDEAYLTGGFLYTPEREQYGGAFVLIPFSQDFEETRKFCELYFYQPKLFVDQIPIQVLNGTKEESLAGLTKMHLARYGFNVVDSGNAAQKEVEKTKIYIRTENDVKETTAALIDLLNAGQIADPGLLYSAENWESEGAEIIIELGEDFVDYYNEHEERFYIGFY